MSLFLCCDCGGSKTAVAVADNSGAIIVRATGGPSNFAYLGLDNFLATIKAAVESALVTLGSTTSSLPAPPESPYFAAAWFGVSGIDHPSAVARLAPALGALLSLPPHTPRLLIANDTALLAAPLAAAVIENPAVRTAVAVVGESESGVTGGAPQELARIGGWGWILGDEGGGFHVGREAVRHLLREHELAIIRGEPLSEASHTLGARVFAHFGVTSAPELLVLVHDADPSPDGPAEAATSAHMLIAREKRLSQLSPLQIALLLEPASGSGSTISTSLAIPAASSLLILGGSLVGVPAYRALVLAALGNRGHVFAGVVHVADAAEAGARALVAQFSGNEEKTDS
ncbi:hypothetical protein DFH11DRAFT_1691290 [Phellopilus nigrolimitatus]|nr:hypothetical protein DFH11DRAFT_1691290 [Phellopilus nigrolimitatus]